LYLYAGGWEKGKRRKKKEVSRRGQGERKEGRLSQGEEEEQQGSWEKKEEEGGEGTIAEAPSCQLHFGGGSHLCISRACSPQEGREEGGNEQYVIFWRSLSCSGESLDWFLPMVPEEKSGVVLRR
jgi:hypothetical protein